MQSLRPPNSCRQCGSTNYRRLFARDAAGVLRHNGSYQCSGCQQSFTRASEWRAVTMDGAASVAGLHRDAMQAQSGLAPP